MCVCVYGTHLCIDIFMLACIVYVMTCVCVCAVHACIGTCKRNMYTMSYTYVCVFVHSDTHVPVFSGLDVPLF